jgi:hypothetical protein
MTYLPVVSAMAFLALFSDSAVQTGEWTMSPSQDSSKVHFCLQGSRNGNDHFSHSSDWNTADFEGMNWSGQDRHDVQFTIRRDAGVFEAEGFLKNGEGAGLFTFKPNEQYAGRIEALGYSDFDADKQMSFALFNVSYAFAREMKSLGIAGLDAQKLISFRIFRVDAAFVNAVRAAGLGTPSAEKLVAMRIHNVTPEYIQSMQAHGLKDLTVDQLIKLRIHGID